MQSTADMHVAGIVIISSLIAISGCGGLEAEAEGPTEEIAAQPGKGDGPNDYKGLFVEPTCGKQCRGACGRDCESCIVSTCANGVRRLLCPTHAGCRSHDTCYDRCRKEANACGAATNLKLFECQRQCDAAAIALYGFADTASWISGSGPRDGTIAFTTSCDTQILK